jgi:hypothetical protein
LYVFSMDEADE